MLYWRSRGQPRHLASVRSSAINIRFSFRQGLSFALLRTANGFIPVNMVPVFDVASFPLREQQRYICPGLQANCLSTGLSDSRGSSKDDAWVHSNGGPPRQGCTRPRTWWSVSICLLCCYGHISETVCSTNGFALANWGRVSSLLYIAKMRSAGCGRIHVVNVRTGTTGGGFDLATTSPKICSGGDRRLGSSRTLLSAFRRM